MKLIREVRKDVRFQYSDAFVNAAGKKKRMTYDDQVFRYAWREIAYFFEQSNEQMTLQEVTELYNSSIHYRFESGFAPYFRSVYTVLKRIDEERALSEKEKEFYSNLLRSQLGSYELAVIGLNALSPVSGNFKFYLTKYRMLKYLPEETTRRNLLVPHYEADAFLSHPD